MQPMRCITTSWDDGHLLDLRLAARLAEHGIKGTFYVPISHPEFPVLSTSGMRELESMGMEIGAHTVNHRPLTNLAAQEAAEELRGGKAKLEDMLGHAVPSFAYPHGKVNRRVRDLAQASGYKLARTTAAFQTSTQFDPLLMPVGFQLREHPRSILARHAVKEGNLGGLAVWLVNCKASRSLEQLQEALLERMMEQGGILHLWGHSWEVDQFDLWGHFEQLVQRMARLPGVRYVTNLEVLGCGNSESRIQNPECRTGAVGSVAGEHHQG